MSRVCQKQDLLKKKKLVKKFAKKRAELKAIVRDLNTPPNERFAAMLKLDKLPKSSSKTRVYNACSVTGRRKGFVGLLGLSRIMARTIHERGELPGVERDSNH